MKTWMKYFLFFGAVVLATILFLANNETTVNEKRTHDAANLNRDLEKINHEADCLDPKKRAKMTRNEIDQWCPVGQ